MREDGEEEGLDTAKHQMVSINPEYIVFGYGPHPWYVSHLALCPYSVQRFITRLSPGRFFAISEIKTILAHILLNYDVQLEDESMERPPNLVSETAVNANPIAKVMFRKRSKVEGN